MNDTVFITKGDYVYRRLREDILNGVFPAGTKLLIKDLSTRYSTSAMPLRNAITRLEEFGLVTSIPYVGAYVSTVNLHDYFSLMLLRIETESVATMMATINANEEIIAELEQITMQMQQAAEEQNAEKYGVANRLFHNTVYTACNNPIILATIENFMNRTAVAVHTFGIIPQTMSISLEEHKFWLDAIRIGDVQKSVDLIRYQRCRSSLALLNHIKLRKHSPVENDIFMQSFINDVDSETIEYFIKMFTWNMKLACTQDLNQFNK